MVNHDMDRCVPCGPDGLDRQRFLYLWRHRLGSLRALHAVTQILDSPVVGPVAREWVVGASADLAAEREEQVRELAGLRTAMNGVSLLLKRACEVEGIPLATVAHGILPSIHFLGDSEGFPWRGHGDDASSIDGAGVAPRPRYRRFYTRFYGDSAIVRPQTHPLGGWGVKQLRGALLTSMELGGCRVVSTTNRRAVIDVPGTFPQTILSALPGRRLVDVVEHAVFEDARFVIRSVASVRSRTLIAFSCPVESVAFDELRPSPGGEHHQLGRDGRLTGIEALHDVLGRRSSAPFLMRSVKGFEAPQDMHVLEGVELDRLWRINLMAPPWAERLSLDG